MVKTEAVETEMSVLFRGFSNLRCLVQLNRPLVCFLDTIHLGRCEHINCAQLQTKSIAQRPFRGSGLSPVTSDFRSLPC